MSEPPRAESIDDTPDGTPDGRLRQLGRDTARRAARRGRLLRRRMTGNAGAFVLLYHRIATTSRDPWQLAVSPDHFAGHLAFLRRHAHPMRLTQFARARAAGTLPRNAVAVTFDDGYADNLHVAKPLLAAADVPATVFLATGYAGRGLPFWWDEVARLILGDHPLPERLRVDGNGRRAPFERQLAAAAPRQALFLDLWEWFAALDGDARHAGLRELQDIVGIPPSPDDPRALTAAEVGELVAGGLVEVGAHTVSHPVLPALSPQRQREEVVRSKADVEAMTGAPVAAFSYPHGRHDPETVRIVRQAGFSVVATAGASSAPWDCARRRGDGLHLPRVSVPDWDAATFRDRFRSGFEA